MVLRQGHQNLERRGSNYYALGNYYQIDDQFKAQLNELKAFAASNRDAHKIRIKGVRARTLPHPHPAPYAAALRRQISWHSHPRQKSNTVERIKQLFPLWENGVKSASINYWNTATKKSNAGWLTMFRFDDSNSKKTFAAWLSTGGIMTTGPLSGMKTGQLAKLIVTSRDTQTEVYVQKYGSSD